MITHKGEKMARGRMIDKRIAKSKKLASLKHDRSRVLYFMILPHLDVEGKFTGDPEEIKEDCCPKLKISVPAIARSVIELADVKLLRLYEVKNQAFIKYTKFAPFQTGIRKDREAPSVIPDPLRSSSGVTPSLYLSLSLSLRKFKESEGSLKTEIYFSFEERKFFNILIEDKSGWKDAYPAVDIESELRKMREWLLANPSKRKSNYRKFINNWLSREQDKGGSQKIEKPYYLSKKERDQKSIDDLVNKYPYEKKEKK